MRSSEGGQLYVPGHVVARVINDATVLFNSRTGEYFTLDDIGTAVWERLARGCSLDDVRDELLQEYDVAADALARDLAHLTERLAAKGLLERTGA